MKIKKPESETHRLAISLLITFIIYFGLNSVFYLLFESRDALLINYATTLSFIISTLSGAGIFLLLRGEDMEAKKGRIEKNIEILEKVLNNDEMLLFKMIIENEGITQDSLRFSTNFSKSKVSAIITELEKNGLIYREKLGRTYRLYAANWLKK